MEYTQHYLNWMKKSGFDADRAEFVYETYFSEYFDDPDLKKTEKSNLRFGLISAAIAHLKTSKYLGLEDNAAYDIRKAWELTKDEYDFIALTLADDAVIYHLKDITVKPYEKPGKTGKKDNFLRDKKKLGRFILITAAIFVISAVMLTVSLYLQRSEPNYDRVLVTVDSITMNMSDTVLVSNQSVVIKGSDYEVLINDHGNIEPLFGIETDDIQYLYMARNSNMSVRVFKYRGFYYLSEYSMLESRLCNRSIAPSVLGMVLSAFLLLIAVPVYIFNRKKTTVYTRLNEIDEARAPRAFNRS